MEITKCPSVTYYYDEFGRRVAILRADGVPFYNDETHARLVAAHPSLKEKELYTLYQGKEFLAWPDAYYEESKDQGNF